MHAFLEAHMGEKPALQPKAAIGPAVRAIGVAILAEARSRDFRLAFKMTRLKKTEDDEY